MLKTVFGKYLGLLNIRTKMILLVTGVVFLSVIPLSLIVLYRNQKVVLDKTIEVCLNLASNISNLATEELLVNENYDSTRTSLSRLRDGKITGFIDSYVVNLSGFVVAELNEKQLGAKVSEKDLSYFQKLDTLNMTEYSRDGMNVLRFAYPIFITTYEKEKIRVGAAVFEFDKKKVYEPVNQIRTTIFVVSAALFIFGFIIAIYTAIYFSRPVQKLSIGAKIIGEGNLNHRIWIARKDELGQLADAFNRMTNQIQDFTHNLEKKVEERTEELNQTLKEVQTLKVAQDGDYFLTSLLVEPLQVNNNKSLTVKTHYITEQKKKFKFRTYDSQIGGDICVTDTITLDGREYCVFVNADAMGKSIQGAGGALVFGVVFNAGLIRSKIMKNQKVFPEVWLRERFLDLQNVFLSFEGSMYISLCMGLIDVETGFMCYVNAEHPWTVLYRDEKASFLEQKSLLKKIGTPEQEDNFAVRIFQLERGDLIFTGSDGKDDIIIGRNVNGNEVINEDEGEFLKRVEEGKARLESIKEKILEKGTFMDDFSLLRVSYRESEVSDISKVEEETIDYALEEILEMTKEGKITINRVEKLVKKFPDSLEALKLMADLQASKGNFRNSITYHEKYFQKRPSDNEVIYKMSFAYRMVGKFGESADWGERLFLRDPLHYMNLLNLAWIYLKLKTLSRAELMINRAIDIYSDNAELVALFNELLELKKERDKNPAEKNKAGGVQKDILSVLKQAEEMLKKKNYQAALMFYEKIFDDFRYHPDALYGAANSCYLMDHKEFAKKYFNRYLLISPDNYEARNQLGEIFYQTGNLELAKSQWQKALELKPGFKNALNNLKLLEKGKSKNDAQ